MTSSHSASDMLTSDAVAQDAGVVDEHVEVAERLDGRVHEALGAVPVGDVVEVGDGLAATGADLGRDLVGRGVVGADTIVGATEVVDHDLGALGREEQGVLAADAAARPGDDRHTPVERCHGRESSHTPFCRLASTPRGRLQTTDCARSPRIGRGVSAEAERRRRTREVRRAAWLRAEPGIRGRPCPPACRGGTARRGRRDRRRRRH